MAAFTHLNPVGDRFTDGSYGVFYVGKSLDTAISETKYHRIRFLSATHEPPQDLTMRVYAVDLRANLHDIRSLRASHPSYYNPNDYTESQRLAVVLREGGSDGIVYASVRDAEGQCAAVFRPPPLSNCRQERHLRYRWDGQDIRVLPIE